MEIWNLKIKEYLSFLPDEKIGSLYNLISVDNELINMFISDINYLENNPNYLLCLRGDSKKTESDHDEFINKTLNKFFIVGNKAKSYYQTNKEDDFEYYEGKSEPEILFELNELVETCNCEICQKQNTHGIIGQINSTFIENIKYKSHSELEHWRLFFISFLHNNGKGKKYKRFKDYSPFISLTYGQNKAITSRKFALEKTEHKRGVVYIVAVDKKQRDYILTRDLTDELLNVGVKWYPDKHEECMLLNGIFPHYILGLFEVQKTRTPRLIINPWLYKEYIEGRNYNSENGIPVNQEYFHDWLMDDNYKRYFYEDYSRNQYISENSQYIETKKINRFK